MLNNLETQTIPARRRHRTYTAQFKAELVAQCMAPGVSIAALAGSHGMNVNVLHRWLREFERDGAHRLDASGKPMTSSVVAPAVEFVPLQLPPPICRASADERVSIELRKGPLSMVVTWPLSALSDLQAWTVAVLQ